MRSVWLAWAFAFSVSYALAGGGRQALAGAAVVALAGTVRELAAVLRLARRRRSR